MKLLTTNQLTIGYSGEKPLAKALDLEILPGELIGLIGQNGVGKSTLIKTLCGLHEPLDGSIDLLESRLESYHSRHLAKNVSIVLTGKPDTLNLSVLELLALGRHPYSSWLGTLNAEDRQCIDKAIDMMAINYIVNKKLFQLSDGQLQKVMIARALVQDTALIILDEPTSHLDLRNKLEVFDKLKEISESGKSLLVSTHEIILAAQTCHRFWCMGFNAPLINGAPIPLIKEGIVDEYMFLGHYLRKNIPM